MPIRRELAHLPPSLSICCDPAYADTFSDAPCVASSPPGADYTIHRLLLGTHTSGQAQDHLVIASVQIPKPVEGKLADYDDEKGGQYAIHSFGQLGSPGTTVDCLARAGRGAGNSRRRD